MFEIITPNNPQYGYVRLEWNRTNDFYPNEIAMCSTEEDVTEAILYAKNQGKSIRIRGGGHNYIGASSGNHTFVIDISNMNKITINYGNNTVEIQGGALLGQIYNLLGAKGYPFPGGTCATVGIGGVVSGGGWGLSTRYFGLACDSVIAASMVDSSGCTLQVDQENNADLFWAIRGGGGGNFGVITSFTFSLPARVNSVTVFTFSYESPSIENQVLFFDTWQYFIRTAPDTINMKGSLLNSETEGIQIRCTGLLYGVPEQLTTILSEFSKIRGYQLNYEQVSFLQAFQSTTSIYPPYEYFIPYGRMVSTTYSREELLELVNRINVKRPNGSTLIQLNVYGLGGKVKNLSPQDTAFFFRESSYIILVETIFENNTFLMENKSWIEQYAAYLYGITQGSYINFPYKPLPDYLCNYYGGNLECLQQIKYKYDPDNRFCFPQSIQ